MRLRKVAPVPPLRSWLEREREGVYRDFKRARDGQSPYQTLLVEKAVADGLRKAIKEAVQSPSSAAYEEMLGWAELRREVLRPTYGHTELPVLKIEG